MYNYMYYEDKKMVGNLVTYSPMFIAMSILLKCALAIMG